MKIGVIGYGNHTGLGCLIFSLKEMLPEICGQYIVKHPRKDKGMNVLPAEYDEYSPEDFYRGKTSIEHFKEWFLRFKPNILLIIEVPFNWAVMPWVKSQGCKIVYMPMLDAVPIKFIQHRELVDCWIVCNEYSAFLIKKAGIQNVAILAAPINTERFAYKPRGMGRGILLHHAGYWGMNGRKGTVEIIQAFQLMRQQLEFKDIRLKLYSQVDVKLAQIPGIEYIIGNQLDVSKMFEEGDAFLAPSKREGIGLSILEAMACGFPVITLNASPMNEYINCSQCLVKTTHTKYGNGIAIEDLAQKMGNAATSPMNILGQYNRQRIEKIWSYEVVRPMYRMILESILK